MTHFSYRYPHSDRGIEVDKLPADDEPTLLLGVNGAGKTTLLRLLAGELRPQRGQVPETTGTVYVPQGFTAIRGFTAIDYVSYVAWLQGRERKQAGRQAGAWIDFVGLAGEADSDCGALSGGQQAKLQLAAGLNSGARRLLLDEPSASLDPIAKADLLEIYTRIVDDGTGLWVSTHQPHEVDTPFTRVIVLDGGRTIFTGGLEEFRAQAERPDAPKVLTRLARATR